MREDVIRLSGGLDTQTSPLGLKPGNLIGSENYEAVIEGGYQRVKGVARYDGRPKPSDAQYTVLSAASWGAGAVVGATLTGASSGATGVIAYVSGIYLAVTKTTDTFDNAEDVTVSAITVGSSITVEPSITAEMSNAMYAAAAAIYSADISAVPGSGPICGVTTVDDVVYAFRNNVGGTAQDVWKATSSGWTAIDYPTTYLVFFSTGSGTEQAGSFTITQGASTATGHRMMTSGGDWDAGTAEGTIALRGAASAGFVTGYATIGSSAAQIYIYVYRSYELAPDGRWQFVAHKFAGVEAGLTVGAKPVYGVDRTDALGGGNFIEFDGKCVVPLLAGGIDGPYRHTLHWKKCAGNPRIVCKFRVS